MLSTTVMRQRDRDTAFWSGVTDALNTLHKMLQKKPKDIRIGVRLDPGSILNGYREGDVSFAQAVGLLNKWKRSATK